MSTTAAASTAREALSPRLAPPVLLVRQKTGFLIAQALADWAVIGACWLAIAKLSAWTWPLWMLVIGGRVHSLGVVLHDAVHMPRRRKTWDFHVIEWLAGHPSCSTVNATRFHHLRHHKESCTEADPYFMGGLLNDKRKLAHQRFMYVVFWLRFLVIVPFWSMRGYFGTLALFRPSMRNAYARAFLQDRSGRDRTHHPETIACCRADVGQAFSHSFVYAFAIVNPSAFLIYIGIPWTIGGLACGYRLLMEHRYQLQPEATIATTLATTREHHVPILTDLLLGPKGIDYHVTHHLHPTVAYQHLPALSEWYAEHYPEASRRWGAALPWERHAARRRLGELGLAAQASA